VSPTPARTSQDAIVAAARAILEEEGLEAVTMVSVAGRVGVRPPSLYKRIRDRGALVEALVAVTAEDLLASLASAVARADRAPGPDPAAERVAAIADAYRAFARRSPRSAALLFADLGPSTGRLVEVSGRAAAPVVEAAEALVGPRRALPAARVLTAFVHGFTSMEAGGAFRLGGDVDDAFRLGVATLVRGLRDERRDE
jgi:AcrR family transcriptional regulator